MVERTNRKDLIVEVASDLFMKQGYEATSVRQIADAVGVTEAALYYHFKDGKQGLLQAVFACQVPNFKLILDECSGAESLADLMQRYGEILAKIAPQLTQRLGWLISEYPNLGEEKHKHIHFKLLAFQEGLAEIIQTFVPDKGNAKAIAWTLLCAALGHSQLFISLDLEAHVDFPFTSLMDNLAKSLP